MSAPDLQIEAAALLKRGSRVEAPSEGELRAEWERLSRELSQSSRPLRPLAWGLCVASVAALGVGLFVHWRRGPEPLVAAASGWHGVTLGAAGELVVRDGSRIELFAEAASQQGHTGPRLRVTSGELCAQIVHRDVAHDGPLVVEAPGFTVTVVGTKFCVDADAAGGGVRVSEGRVRVQGANGTSAEVSAGGSVHFDALAPTPVAPPKPKAAEATAAPPGTVPPAPGQAARRLDSALAPDNALAVVPAPFAVPPASAKPQVNSAGGELGNDLFRRALDARERGDTETALLFFKRYLEDFPRGPLRPEAVLAVMQAEVAQNDPEDALAEARQVPAPGAPDAEPFGEVHLLEADLLRDALKRPQDALELYDALLAHDHRPELREQAAFGALLAARAMGDSAAAQQRLAAYRREFPHGSHATALDSLSQDR